MSEKDANGTMQRTTVPVGLSYLEKAWEWNWVLRFSHLILFVDLALLLRGGHGLLEWSVTSESWMESLSFLFVSMAAFGLMASFLIPLAAQITQSVLGIIIYSVPWARWMLATPRVSSKPSGSVRPWYVYDLALREQNTFLLSLYEAHMREREQAEQERQQIGNLIFGVILLAVVDGLAPIWGYEDSSLIATAFMRLGEGGVWMAMVVVLASGAAIKWAWYSDRDSGWIYYPPLCRELESRDSARAGMPYSSPAFNHHQR